MAEQWVAMMVDWWAEHWVEPWVEYLDVAKVDLKADALAGLTGTL